MAYFSKFGPVKDCYLIPQQRMSKVVSANVHRGMAYLNYVDHLSAEKCLNASDHEIQNQKVEIGVSTLSRDAPPGRNSKKNKKDEDEVPVSAGARALLQQVAAHQQGFAQPSTSAPEVVGDEGGEILCLKEIPPNLTQRDLLEYFSKYGQITDLRMPLNRSDPSRHRGLCMITYANPVSMIRVLLCARTQPHSIHGHALYTDVVTPSQMVAMAESPIIQKVATLDIQPEYKGFGTNTFRRVFVSKVPPEADENVLHTYFSKFGDVDDVFRPQAGAKGVAFVKFRCCEPARAAVAIRNHYILDGTCCIAGESMERSDGGDFLPKGQGKGDFAPPKGGYAPY